jgi:hypothetical protein
MHCTVAHLPRSPTFQATFLKKADSGRPFE